MAASVRLPASPPSSPPSIRATTEPSERAPLLPRSASVATSIAASTLDDIDSRFKRWKEAVAIKIGKGKQKEIESPSLLVSVFEPCQPIPSHGKSSRRRRTSTARNKSESDISADVAAVREAIQAGVLPKMIQTGSSGSYFARRKDGSFRGVFKPSDEEPYGNLNPKRAFLRRYFWWAMGRPCLLSGFSAMSEAGASLLDDRLDLGMVPKTKLVKLSSPSFHYHYKDRMAYEHHGNALPEKIGSFQSFLHGYVMASTFLRQHPLPSRPRSILERDLEAEQRAHRKARKQYKARLRKCGVKLKYIVLCRQGFEDIQYDASTEVTGQDIAQAEEDMMGEDDFLWTPESLQAFRLELEKLVIFDYLCRNTDRGLDNFMVKHTRDAKSTTIKLGAIDNSLAWPVKHPDGIRDYPYGWLYLPSDLIGGPFSQATRDLFLPLLSSPKWWYETEQALLELFKQDEHFSAKLFESQMAVFKGQGWNAVQSLGEVDEGPIELCARQKKVVRKSEQIITESAARDLQGVKLALTPSLEQASGADMSHDYGSPKLSASAQPLPIGRGSNGTSESPATVPTTEDTQPRSLPEASTAPVDGDAAASNASRRPPLPSYPSSLGIEVLESIDKATKKSKRPAIAKAMSGPDIFTRSPQQGKSSLEAQRLQQRETRRERGKLVHKQSDEHRLRESDGEEDEPSSGAVAAQQQQEQARMSSSDYFTYGVGRHKSNEEGILPSIDSTLAGATPAKNSMAVAAAPASTPAPLQKKLQRPSRRRPRNWSVTSFGTRYRDIDQDDDRDEASPLLPPTGADRLVKVVVEKLVDDKSLPWQAWLRA